MDQSGGLYAKLEERILARDQIGASAVYYDLVRAERPRAEIVGETVRIHAPYTHVPYHQRIDDGFVRFVNNDHCLLSARTSLRLPKLLAPALEYLPLAQTIWYVPTGLDPWNQLLGKMPGHYGGRGQKRDPNKPIAPPERHWPDQQPFLLDGPFEERLNHWLTLVQRGDVLEAYRVFLGLFAERKRRPELLAHLAFAGLIDVQDRMLYNRSYTTGHKAHRARATIEIGEAVGWEAAHDVLYAGALDMAVGPRWHAAYEMACQVSWMHLAEDDAKVKSSMEPSPKRLVETRLLANSAPPTARPTRGRRRAHARSRRERCSSGWTPRRSRSSRTRAWRGPAPISTPATIARRSSRPWRSARSRKATIPTTRRSAWASSRTGRAAPLTTATRCCSRVPTIRPGTRSSATRSKPIDGSQRRCRNGLASLRESRALASDIGEPLVQPWPGALPADALARRGDGRRRPARRPRARAARTHRCSHRALGPLALASVQAPS